MSASVRAKDGVGGDSFPSIVPGSSRLNGIGGSAQHVHATLGDCSPQLLVEALSVVVESGCFIGLARTSDGGALCLFVKDGRDKKSLYAANEDELQLLLEQIRDAYQD